MSKRDLPRTIGFGLIILLILGAAIYFFGPRLVYKASQEVSPSAVSAQVDDMPSLADKPKPSEISYMGCPPEGQGGDIQLNLLKNRVDEGSYLAVAYDSLLALRWPKNVEQSLMKDWTDANISFISQYQGMPVMLEGYMLSAKEAPPDTSNCNRNNPDNVDWTVSISKNVGDDPSQAVNALITPRIRATHTWTLDLIRSIVVYSHAQVRVSGWLLFSPDHPGAVGKTTATLWGIHPVMQIEILQNGIWVALDKLAN